MRKKKSEDKWDKLMRLISQYTFAYTENSWKGSGHPETFPVVEARLNLARAELNEHVNILKRLEEQEGL